MKVIGLTGGIACGKSHVSSVLEKLGAVIIDGDKISHELTKKGGAAVQPIREIFGDDVISPDGSVDRKKLGAIVFSSEKSRAKLNSIVHPMVIDTAILRIQQEKKKGTEACVLDMPLLFESHLDDVCDACWCVCLEEKKQLQRLMERDKLTEEEAIKRISSQMSQSQRKNRCQAVISTDGTLEETEAQVVELYSKEIGKQI